MLKTIESSLFSYEKPKKTYSNNLSFENCTLKVSIGPLVEGSKIDIITINNYESKLELYKIVWDSETPWLYSNHN